MSWNREEQISSEIQEIKTLQSKEYTTWDILDRNEFSYDSLKACGLPISYLVPKLEGQKLTLQEWDTHTSIEHKWELVNGLPFGQEDERDRVMLGLIYTAGLKHLLELLPEESKRELIKLIKQSDME